MIARRNASSFLRKAANAQTRYEVRQATRREQRTRRATGLRFMDERINKLLAFMEEEKASKREEKMI